MPFARWVTDVLAEFWRWLHAPVRRRRGLVQAVVSEGGLPSNLKPKILYVVKEEGVAWQAALICPCGCGDQLDLNLLPDERPCWQVRIGVGGVASLHPSVRRTEGCKSHFFLREGRIIWAERAW